ncbi:MAG: hypothetical protein ACJATE_001097 [Bacteroidia bacterium]
MPTLLNKPFEWRSEAVTTLLEKASTHRLATSTNIEVSNAIVKIKVFPSFFDAVPQ